MAISTSSSSNAALSSSPSVSIALYSFAVSIWSLLILLPSYTVLHDVKFSAVLVSIKMSELDKLTIADSLQNRDVVVLALCMTFLYTSFAFFAIVV